MSKYNNIKFPLTTNNVKWLSDNNLIINPPSDIQSFIDNGNRHIFELMCSIGKKQTPMLYINELRIYFLKITDVFTAMILAKTISDKTNRDLWLGWVKQYLVKNKQL